ncbi:YdcF family protein [Hymenobacter guriensis]
MALRTTKRWLSLGFGLLAGWFLLHTTIITADGLFDTSRPADCIVVLGNTVNTDGSLSSRLKARLDKALALYRAGSSATIFVSGGLGK